MLVRHSLLIHTTDPELYLILRYILEQAGHDVELAPNLEIVLNALQRENACKTILVCLSVEDLLRASTLIRKERPELCIVGFPLANKPINDTDLVYFDHLVKRPFDPSDLLNFLQFGAPPKPRRQNAETVTLADIEIDLAAIRVRRGDTDIHLSPLHFRLLAHLATHSDRVVTRDELIERCWPADAIVEPRTVDIHVGRIRQALNQYGDDVIRTVRSMGYAAAKE